MGGFEKSKDLMEERRQALIQELELVHTAISEISNNAQTSENSKLWLQKLRKWHDELHELVQKFPHSQR